MAFKVNSPKIKNYPNDWIQTTPNEYYNKKLNSKIDISTGVLGYKVSVTNLTTHTVETISMSGLTQEQAQKVAKDYMVTSKFKLPELHIKDEDREIVYKKS